MNISILGCGWLGFPLAQRLLSLGYSIKGSTTTQGKVGLLKQNGIESFLIKLPESMDNQDTDPFWNTDTLFLNIPPGIKKKNSGLSDYTNLIQSINDKAQAKDISWIIFASSTSVYGEFGGVTKEEDASLDAALNPSGEALLKSEKIVRKSGADYTILRLGGLYGYGRHPIQYLSGKKKLDGANKPVNLIHQTDCINIITEIILQKKRNEIYNLVSDGHPPRKAFYESAADHFNLPKPTFMKDSDSDYKIVSNKKMKEDLLYSFSYPNPMDHTP
ncbi:MAG: SDR family oxidoreductase [Balneolaceae bacterium]